MPEATTTSAFTMSPGSLQAHQSLQSLESLDPDAWERLYADAWPVLWRFARTRLVTAEQAEDAVSETMVRAMAGIGRYCASPHRSSGVLGWMVGIERNVIHEIYRAAARLRAVPFARDAIAGEPIDRLIAADEERAVRLAFARLPDDDRELLALRVVDSLDSVATARILGKRSGAVRMAQARALGRMRVTLDEADRDW